MYIVFCLTTFTIIFLNVSQKFILFLPKNVRLCEKIDDEMIEQSRHRHPDWQLFIHVKLLFSLVSYYTIINYGCCV